MSARVVTIQRGDLSRHRRGSAIGKFVLLVWRVFVANRKQCPKRFRFKLELALGEIKRPSAVGSLSCPLKTKVAGRIVEVKVSDPLSLEELLKDGFQVGTYRSFVRTFHMLEKRDSALLASAKQSATGHWSLATGHSPE